MFLRDNFPESPKANVGDLFINEGVANAFRVTHDLDIRWCERNAFRRDRLPEDTDILVYAGMPQLGAREKLTEEEEVWKYLRERYPASITKFNIGCGTGYSLLDNRLLIAADMASYSEYRKHYQSQRDVCFLPRDPVSWNFLNMIGVDSRLSICPSGFNQPNERVPHYRIAICAINPADTPFLTHESSTLKFSIKDIFIELAKQYPDALFIAQGHSDIHFFSDIGIKNYIAPKTASAFIMACSSAHKLISFRVHGTVCSLLSGRSVLHFAIDGRSDLLTPYLDSGLWKRNLFSGSVDEHIECIQEFIGTSFVSDVKPIVLKELQLVSKTINSHLSGINRIRWSPIGCLITDPETVPNVNPGDEIVFSHKKFSCDQSFKNERSILCPLLASRNHVVYGPYKRLPKGKYWVLFDLDFWGKLRSKQEAKIGFDIVDSSDNILADVVVQCRDVINRSKLSELEFLNISDASKIEMRIRVLDNMPSLSLEFFGVRIKRIE